MLYHLWYFCLIAWLYGQKKTQVNYGRSFNVTCLMSISYTWSLFYCSIIFVAIQSDVIMVLGNHDLRTAQHGAELWLQEMAPWILFSGKEGANTIGKFCESVIW